LNKEKTGRGPKISLEVRRLIIGQAIHDNKNMPRRALAVRLQELIEKMGEISPTEDTLARIISEARNQQPSELDQPWHIGICTQHDIPPSIIPELFKLQKFKASRKKEDSSLTIREAQWATRLFPAAQSVVNKLFTDEYGQQALFSIIVSCYVQREKVSLQMDEPYPNTTDLDSLFFANSDALNNDSLEKWWSVFPPEYQLAVAEVLESRRLQAIKEVEQNNGRQFTRKDAEDINKGFEVLKKDGPLAFREWEKQHPVARENNLADLDWGTIYAEALKGDQQ
jgi:hypothetical protein